MLPSKASPSRRVPQGERLMRLIDHCRQNGRVTADEAAVILNRPRYLAASGLRQLAEWGWFRHVDVCAFALTPKSAAWRGTVKMRILAALKTGRAMHIGDVAGAIGRPHRETRVYLCKLFQRGLIGRVSEGVYCDLEVSREGM